MLKNVNHDRPYMGQIMLAPELRRFARADIL